MDEKTTVRLPSTGQATVHGPATVDTEPGASIQVSGWYRSFEKYGFAGLVAFLFGWTIFNQFAMYQNLMAQRERDAERHHKEIADLSQKFEVQLEKLQDRADQRDERTRERFWAVLAEIRTNVKQIMQFMGVFPKTEPLPKTEET